MSFYSIYQPAYLAAEFSCRDLKKRFWYTVAFVVSAHILVFLLLRINVALTKNDQIDQIVIEVTQVSEASDGIPDGVKTTEPQKVVKPSRVPIQNKAPSPEIKPNDFLIEEPKPKSEIKPEPKPEPKPEKKIVEEKKVESPVQSTVDVPMLPTIADKKDKEKDAPKVAAPLSSDSRPASTSASSSPSSSEFQAQVSAAPPMGISGGSAPTADADYKSAGLRNPKPPYPMMAYKMKQQGTVVLLAEVLTNGKAGEVKVLNGSGFDLLDKSAVEAVRRWTFNPARKDGVVYVQLLRIPITFSLKDK